MRRRSYSPSPPRGCARRGRSPSPRGRYGGHSRDLPTSLLVRNLCHDCRPEDLRRPFGQFGPVKDIYLPRDYYTGEPQGFGFVQFVDPNDAAEAKYQMDGQGFQGRQLTVVFAEENRKKPTEMRSRERSGSYRSSRSHDWRRPLDIPDLHLHGMQNQGHTVTTLPREGSTRGLSHLKRKDTVVTGHIHNLLHATFLLLHHIMDQGVAAKLQSGSVHYIMTVEGAAAEVLLGGSVLQLGVTAGALVGALVVLPTRHDVMCLHDTEPLYL